MRILLIVPFAALAATTLRFGAHRLADRFGWDHGEVDEALCSGGLSLLRALREPDQG